MGKIISKALAVRLSYERRIGRHVPLTEIAEATGVYRQAIARLEEDKTERYDGEMLAKLCAFYEVRIEDMLEYQPGTN